MIGSKEKEIKGERAKRRCPTAAITKSHKAAAKKITAERVKAGSFRSLGWSPPASKAVQVKADKNNVDARSMGCGIPASQETTEKKQDMPAITSPG